jgi:hypothetical protein
VFGAVGQGQETRINKPTLTPALFPASIISQTDISALLKQNIGGGREGVELFKGLNY